MPAEPAVHADITVSERTITRTDNDVRYEKNGRPVKSCLINFRIHRGLNDVAGSGYPPDHVMESGSENGKEGKEAGEPVWIIIRWTRYSGDL